MLPEVYFLRYAFPCARVLVDFRKTLTEEEYDLMRDAVENDRPMPREYLEKKFTKAVQGLKAISDDIWNVETIRRYFCGGKEHEQMLSTDLPPIVKRLCVVKKGVLGRKIEKDGEVFFHINFGAGDIRVVTPLYKGAASGDIVMVHYGYAVEKV